MKSPRHTGNVRSWWNSHGEFHRVDGPAIEMSDGSKAWWRNGKRHRDGNEYLVEGPSPIQENIVFIEMFVIQELMPWRWVCDWYRDEMLRNETLCSNDPKTYPWRRTGSP